MKKKMETTVRSQSQVYGEDSDEGSGLTLDPAPRGCPSYDLPVGGPYTPAIRGGLGVTLDAHFKG